MDNLNLEPKFQLSYNHQLDIQAKSTQPGAENVRTSLISDQSEDRHGAILVQKGWQLETYNKLNPVVMYGHAANYYPDPDLIVGKGFAFLDEGQSRLFGSVDFDVNGEGVLENKIAKKALYKIDEGYLFSTSVGLMPLKWSFGDKDAGENINILYVRSMELLEFSIVAVPANKNATFNKDISFDSFIKSVLSLEEFINDGAQHKLVEKIYKHEEIVGEKDFEFDIHPDNPEQRITNMQALIDIARAKLIKYKN